MKNIQVNMNMAVQEAKEQKLEAYMMAQMSRRVSENPFYIYQA